MAQDIGPLLGEYSDKLSLVLEAATRRRSRLIAGIVCLSLFLFLLFLVFVVFADASMDNSNSFYEFVDLHSDLIAAGIFFSAFSAGFFLVWLLFALRGITAFIEREGGHLADIIERIVRKLRSQRDQLSREERDNMWGIEFRLIEAEALLKRYNRLCKAFRMPN